MRGEHGTKFEPGDEFGEGGRLDIQFLDRVNSSLEPFTFPICAMAELVNAMSLFGHIGEVEVRGEGPNQADRCGDVEAADQCL